MSDSEGELRAARHNSNLKTYGGQSKRWYYKPWGDKVLLPSDPWSLEIYLLKGYTLTPPTNPIPSPRDGAEEYFVKDSPRPLEMQTKEPELDEVMVRKVIEAMDKNGYSFVKVDQRADTPTESETKLQVSPVSTSSNGDVPSKKEE